MPIYRTHDFRIGRSQVVEWWRGVLHTVAVLLVVLAVCTIGMIALDSSGQPFSAKVLRGLWNALNLVTTLGDFTSLDPREKIFMMSTMVLLIAIGGYAVSRLTGMLSSDAAMIHRENRRMAHKLDRLANHVIVIGFGALGRAVAGRLSEAGEQVVIVDRAGDLAAQASDLRYLVVQGDAGVDDAVLDHSGVDRARSVVVTTEDADRKLSITLMAHARNPKLKIAVTAMNEPRGELLRRAGASEVLMTDDLIAGALVDCLSEKGKA